MLLDLRLLYERHAAAAATAAGESDDARVDEGRRPRALRRITVPLPPQIAAAIAVDDEELVALLHVRIA